MYYVTLIATPPSRLVITMTHDHTQVDKRQPVVSNPFDWLASQPQSASPNYLFFLFTFYNVK